jgi:putative nucleotidyltransferase with HDIG domain
MAATTKTLRLPGWLHDILERHIEEDAELPVLPEAPQRALVRLAKRGGDARTALGDTKTKLGTALRERVFQLEGHQSLMRAIWAHSVVAADFAREIAVQLGKNTEEAFLLGLLHDVGRPIVLRASIDTLAHRSKEPLPDDLLETAMDAFHAEVGARILAAWKLPEPYTVAVEYHHDPAKGAPHEAGARLACCADALSHWALDDSLGSEDFPAAHATIAELGLSSEHVESLRAYRGKALEFAEALL